MRCWRHKGSGPRSFKVGRHVRYWRTDLILWLAEQRVRRRSDDFATVSVVGGEMESEP